jgi:hypothetical protein
MDTLCGVASAALQVSETAGQVCYRSLIGKRDYDGGIEPGKGKFLFESLIKTFKLHVRKYVLVMGSVRVIYNTIRVDI